MFSREKEQFCNSDEECVAVCSCPLAVEAHFVRALAV